MDYASRKTGVVLSFFLLAEIRQHTIENGKYDAESQCPPKSINIKSWNYRFYQEHDDSIDHQKEKAQRKNCNRNCKDDKNRSDQDIKK